VNDKAKRVASFHRNTMKALGEVLGSAGLSHPSEVMPSHIHIRQQPGVLLRADQAYPRLAWGSLLDGRAGGDLAREWDRAQPDTFTPAG
jgi:hypothetical protein